MPALGSLYRKVADKTGFKDTTAAYSSKIKRNEI
jgi:hypothetical protein